MQFATSFSMKVIGYGDEIFPFLEDGSLAYIVNNLFRPSEVNTIGVVNIPSSQSRSLIIKVYLFDRRAAHDYHRLSLKPSYTGPMS